MAAAQCLNHLPMVEFGCHQCNYRTPMQKSSVKLLSRYLTTDDILLIRSGKFGSWEDVRKYLAVELLLIRYEDDPQQMIAMEVCISLLKFSNLKCLKPLQASICFSLVMDAFQYFMNSKTIVQENDAQKYFTHLLNQNVVHFKSCKTMQRIKQFYHNIFLFHYDLFRLVFTPQVKLEFHILKKDMKEKKAGRIVKCVCGPVMVSKPVANAQTTPNLCNKDTNLMSIYQYLTNTKFVKFCSNKDAGKPGIEKSGALSYILDPKFQCKLVSFGSEDQDQESLNERTLRIRKEVAKLLIGKDSDLCMILSNTQNERNVGTCPPPNSCRNLCTNNDVKEIHSEPKFYPDKETSKDRPHSCHSTPLPGAPKASDTEKDLYMKHMEEKVHKNFLHHHMNCEYQGCCMQCGNCKPNAPGCCAKDCMPPGYRHPMYPEEAMYGKRMAFFRGHQIRPDIPPSHWHHTEVPAGYKYPCPCQMQCQCHMQFQCQFNCHHHRDSGINIEVQHKDPTARRQSVDSNVDTLICLYSQQNPSKLESDEEVTKDKKPQEENEMKDEPLATLPNELAVDN